MSNLREHHLNRKAESAALRYLAQKEVAKTSKADWICIALSLHGLALPPFIYSLQT
jgi:hypothetical protein